MLLALSQDYYENGKAANGMSQLLQTIRMCWTAVFVTW
jgi:hypothetical protein